MASGPESDELINLQAENRHLKEMVAALRDELERMRIAQQEHLQKSLASANDEIGQLKGTITALREELERQKVDHEERSSILERAGRELYRRREWDRAIARFNEALRLNPEEELCRMYIERCTLFAKEPPGGDWDGGWVMKTK